MEQLKVGLCTDSSAQLPPELAARYGVEVVPITVVVDGEAYEEGVDLDAEAFYGRFANGEAPRVTTSQPSPGRFAGAYAALAARGAEEILSIHVASAISGTLNAARLGAEAATAPVRHVDTGTASFGVACCLLEAARALEAGATTEQAARTAECLAPSIGNAFVTVGPTGGRLSFEAPRGASLPVLTFSPGSTRVIADAHTAEEAVAAMTDYVRGFGPGTVAAVGMAAAETKPLADALAAALRATPEVGTVLRYRVGPSVGAHTGPGAVGTFCYPAPRSS